MESVGLFAAAVGYLTSPGFKKFVKTLQERKPQLKPQEVGTETVDELAEKQAEGLTYEQIYLNLLSGNISALQATKIIEGLGEKVNPNPFTWLKNKLMDTRGWIIDAVKFLRTVGNELGLRVDKVEVELSITPHITISFQSSTPSSPSS